MDRNEQKTMSIPAAGKKYFDLGRNGSYDAAKRGEIPTIKIGARFRVPVVVMERMLSEAGARSDDINPHMPAFGKPREIGDDAATTPMDARPSHPLEPAERLIREMGTAVPSRKHRGV
jgi:hypothetical protein